MRNATRRAPFLLAGAIAAVLALPAFAQAAVVTLSQNEGGSGINHSAADGSVHPADVYPSTIIGPAGTVDDVNVFLQVNHNHVDDLDVTLMSPNDTAVHIISDACGDDDGFNNLSFDDEGGVGFLSNLGPCTAPQTYFVSNFDGDDTAGVETDIYSPAPGGASFPDGANTLNALSFFDGGPSGGAWRLFSMDDKTGDGGGITSWSITLDFTPAQTQSAPPPSGTQPSSPAAKKKCKKKKKKRRSASAAKKCKKKR